MTPPDPATPQRRRRLTRDVVIAAAVDLADDIGVEPLTIRRLAEALGVKPMSLYHHVANKDAILDGMVDAVFAEMPLPAPDLDWRTAGHHGPWRTGCAPPWRCHPWATPLLDEPGQPRTEATLMGHNDDQARRVPARRLPVGAGGPRSGDPRRLRVRLRHPGGIAIPADDHRGVRGARGRHRACRSTRTPTPTWWSTPAIG